MLRQLINTARSLVHKIPGYFSFRWFLFHERPKAINGKVLLHIGCGKINRPYFINIDSAFYPHLHFKRNISSKRLWSSCSADLIYISHVLEHVRRDDVENVLTNLYQILKPGGILRVSVPDFDAIVKIYRLSSRDVTIVSGELMGGQSTKHDFHYEIYNKKRLNDMLMRVGFKKVREWHPDQVEYHDFDDWANFCFRIGDQRIPISLNIEAVK